MFVPIHDANPIRRIRWCFVNAGLVAANVLVFVLLQSGLLVSEAESERIVISFGVIPVILFDTMTLPAGYYDVPPALTPLTASFLHAGWLHLGGNMLFLWTFGDNVEDALGHARYLLFYVAAVVISAFGWALITPGSVAPMIGASGAVSAVVAAYLLLHPRVRVWVLVLKGIPLRVPAVSALGAWIAFQIVNAAMAGADDPTAWTAHLIGLAAGAVLLLLLKPKSVPLFDQPARGDRLNRGMREGEQGRGPDRLSFT